MGFLVSWGSGTFPGTAYYKIPPNSERMGHRSQAAFHTLTGHVVCMLWCLLQDWDVVCWIALLTGSPHEIQSLAPGEVGAGGPQVQGHPSLR